MSTLTHVNCNTARTSLTSRVFGGFPRFRSRRTIMFPGAAQSASCRSRERSSTRTFPPSSSSRSFRSARPHHTCLLHSAPPRPSYSRSGRSLIVFGRIASSFSTRPTTTRAPTFKHGCIANATTTIRRLPKPNRTFPCASMLTLRLRSHQDPDALRELPP
ncbi:hypothetical protein BCR44DRAFT_310331 [Catenaria anguillulae PL171]|uniref:Uncharacterized protein n=1 Tax=Catenaria anguillulae PL171 TaxID=765915 RepID=A0A1Y2HUL8_9FUNG|nr:hypothetical protein BCR44DRAFT_310331 [Catenaria anguillulae PL171]